MRRVQLFFVVVIALSLLLIAVPASAAPAASAGGPGCSQFYTIQCGDTLNRIAARFGTSVWALANLNGISNPDRIYAGQTICVSGGGPPPHQGGFWYTIKCGDMLRVIAARHGLGTWELARINGIANPDRIYAGQRLWIPAW